MHGDFIIEFAATCTLDSLKGRCSTPSGVFQERILTDHMCRIFEHCIELRVVNLLYILVNVNHCGASLSEYIGYQQ